MAMPSLDDAFAKLENARSHLADFKKIEDDLAQAPDNLSHVIGDVRTGQVKVTASSKPIPKKAQLKFGDAINNLRSALDYLIHELAFLDAGRPVEGTQFPICDSGKSFDAQKESRLHALTAGHVDRIKILQPFNGVLWLATLRDFSNPDKHRFLISAKRKDVGTSKALPFIRERNGHLTRIINIEIKTIISLEDGRPAVTLLEELCDHVADLLASFSGEFR